MEAPDHSFRDLCDNANDPIQSVSVTLESREGEGATFRFTWPERLKTGGQGMYHKGER